MEINKYRWRYRIILIETPDYKNENYKNTKIIYQSYIKEFHKRYIKLVTYKNSKVIFNLKLIGFDGKIKKEFKKLIPENIFKIVDNMPFSKILKDKSKGNLSLFSDYNPSNTVKGLGFKNKNKALYTLKAIKDKPLKYQISLVNTMIGRAKTHPYRNENMNQGIKVYQKWLDNYKDNLKK